MIGMWESGVNGRRGRHMRCAPETSLRSLSKRGASTTQIKEKKEVREREREREKRGLRDFAIDLPPCIPTSTNLRPCLSRRPQPTTTS